MMMMVEGSSIDGSIDGRETEWMWWRDKSGGGALSMSVGLKKQVAWMKVTIYIQNIYIYIGKTSSEPLRLDQ